MDGTDGIRTDFNAVVMAIGMRSYVAREQVDGLFYAGDIANGPTTVVEAVASGKNTALEIDACLKKQEKPEIKKATKVLFRDCPAITLCPFRSKRISSDAKFISPYLLSASPLTDGFEQMNKAYEHGWAGGIMKTAFDNVPIHIPAEYMFTLQRADLRQRGQCLRSSRWIASAARSSS